ncbi:SDR family oxidoreductase [Synechococcus sp. PCC 6312]|uniref:SDR family oxidoreductase n=1 Tax=Synechococcus sp. (strain ATCC 27167 / PCC 6312) TaxID=195253 RepID=UPI00029F02CF|nr:SDR family oxidoreductase [Synechococcus sp. PCC 6312]AFY61549.1 putative nucleoside-diphosphate sugar epimerase [Synechococcus sp. PCC 6312]
MSLLVVGATGTLGRQIVRRALDEGLSVHCLVRNRRKAAFLKEWGAHLIPGDICEPETLPPALEGITQVIDAATARATDSLSIKDVDWQGKINLIQALERANIQRYIFFSIMAAADYPHVPLMDIKYCTEKFIQESTLNYTILRPCGFYQGLIGQYAIPILEGQSVWLVGENTPLAYMDTQDLAKFAIQALKSPATERQSYDLAGPKAWGSEDIVRVCERLSGKTAKITRIPLGLLRSTRNVVSFFEWGWNVADRLAFTEVIATGKPLNCSMDNTYQAFELAPEATLTLEAYMQEYFSRIMRKLKELDYEKSKQKKQSRKRSPFKSSNAP